MWNKYKVYHVAASHSFIILRFVAHQLLPRELIALIKSNDININFWVAIQKSAFELNKSECSYDHNLII